MHFGAAIRDLLSTTCGSDLRTASARTVVAALEAPDARQRLAAGIEARFGVAIPAAELERLRTVRDVLQCVRLRRWAARVEARTAATTSAAQVDASGQRAFRFTRRDPVAAPPLGGGLPHSIAAKRL